VAWFHDSGLAIFWKIPMNNSRSITETVYEQTKPMSNCAWFMVYISWINTIYSWCLKSESYIVRSLYLQWNWEFLMKWKKKISVSCKKQWKLHLSKCLHFFKTTNLFLWYLFLLMTSSMIELHLIKDCRKLIFIL